MKLLAHAGNEFESCTSGTSTRQLIIFMSLCALPIISNMLKALEEARETGLLLLTFQQQLLREQHLLAISKVPPQQLRNLLGTLFRLSKMQDLSKLLWELEEEAMDKELRTAVLAARCALTGIRF